MKRGRFFQTITGVIVLPFFSNLFGSSIQSTQKGFKVRSNESRTGRHSIMKGVTSNAFDVKISSKDTNGELSVFEQLGLTPKGGPPLHIHPNQDEYFYILEGEFQFQVGQDKYHLSVGETIFLPRNVQHAFIQLTQKTKALISYNPAGKMESFFEVTDAWTSKPSDDLIRKTFADHDMIVVGPPLTEDPNLSS